MSDIFAPLSSSIRQHSHLLVAGRCFYTDINDDGTAQSYYNTSLEDNSDEHTDLPYDHTSEVIKVLHALIEYPSQRHVSNMFAIDSMRFCIDMVHLGDGWLVIMYQVNATENQEDHDTEDEPEDLCEEDPCEEDPC